MGARSEALGVGYFRYLRRNYLRRNDSHPRPARDPPLIRKRCFCHRLSPTWNWKLSFHISSEYTMLHLFVVRNVLGATFRCAHVCCISRQSAAYATQYSKHAIFSGDFHWAHGVVVSHPLRMRKALGSNPSVSIFCPSQILLSDVRASND